MKKIICIILLVIIIPGLVVQLFFYYDKKYEVGIINNQKDNDIFIRVKHGDNSISKVNLEDYVIGVVASEMPISFEEEALKSQAVAARTYALKSIKKDLEYDVTDDTNYQVYSSFDKLKEKWNNKYNENLEKIKKCVNSTKGEYLTYNNEIIYALYFSTSNGMTENNEDVFGSDLPYLKSVSSEGDLKENPNYISYIYLNKNEFFSKLEYPNSDKLIISDIKKTKSNRIKSLNINNNEIGGREFQKKLGLRSNDFEININNDNIIIAVKGFGHGVGMSQYGANYLAKNNKKYVDILKYYYNGVEIKKIY